MRTPALVLACAIVSGSAAPSTGQVLAGPNPARAVGSGHSAAASWQASLAPRLQPGPVAAALQIRLAAPGHALNGSLPSQAAARAGRSVSTTLPGTGNVQAAAGRARPAEPSFEAAAAPGGIPAADAFNNAFGFYRWLSAMPELAGTGWLGRAAVLLAAEPLLSKGEVMAMKEAGALTLLSAKDPSAPGVRIALDRGTLLPAAPSPQALALARELERAETLDAADKTFFNVAALLARLGALAREAPSGEAAPAIETGELPLDPVRQPREYLDRVLRDAMRSDDPHQALDLLRRARAEARAGLDYGSGSRFLERLRSQAELMARRFMPGLLDAAQLEASRNDKRAAARVLAAAEEFTEYAPAWRERFVEAWRRAQDTMALLDRYGPVDPATGLPPPPA